MINKLKESSDQIAMCGEKQNQKVKQRFKHILEYRLCPLLFFRKTFSMLLSQQFLSSFFCKIWFHNEPLLLNRSRFSFVFLFLPPCSVFRRPQSQAITMVMVSVCFVFGDTFTIAMTVWGSSRESRGMGSMCLAHEQNVQFT